MFCIINSNNKNRYLKFKYRLNLLQVFFARLFSVFSFRKRIKSRLTSLCSIDFFRHANVRQEYFWHSFLFRIRFFAKHLSSALCPNRFRRKLTNRYCLCRKLTNRYRFRLRKCYCFRLKTRLFYRNKSYSSLPFAEINIRLFYFMCKNKKRWQRYRGNRQRRGIRYRCRRT